MGTTADGRKKGQPSTAEIACHVAAALYLDLAREHAGPEPPPCWKAAGCSPDERLTRIKKSASVFAAAYLVDTGGRDVARADTALGI